MMQKKLAFILAFVLFTFVCAHGGQPLRIVSHLPSFTEIVYTLGLGDQVVGVDDFVQHPPDVKTKPRVGGVMNTNYEAVLALRPTHVLVDVSMKEHLQKYKALGINTVVAKTMSVEDALQSITVLGSALGRRPQAESLEAKIRGELEQIKTARADKTPLRTLVVIGHDPGELRAIFAAAKGSYHDQLLEMVGGANVFDMRIGSYPNISKEILIQKNPQAILVLAPYASVKKQTDEQERRIWSSLGVIEAVKNGCVYLLTDDCVQQPGLRMPKAARLFAQKLDDCAAKME